MKLRFVNFEDHFDKSFVLTDPEGIDKKQNFSLKGVFSEAIFGKMHGESTHFTCDPSCETLTGRYLLGVTCKQCGSKVEERSFLLDKRGWIDFGGYKVINPAFLPFLEKLIGPSLLKKILKYEKKLDVNGNFDEGSEITSPNDLINLGVYDFCEEIESIIDFFHNEDKKGEKDHYYKILKDNIDKICISKLPVVSHRLRPAVVRSTEVTFDKVNNLYNRLIALTNSLSSMVEEERIPLIVFPNLFAIQDLVNQIYDNQLEVISGKGGWLRSNLMSNRMNFSARAVITPADVSNDIDALEIPYITGVELFRFHIINVLVSLKQVSYSDAHNIWSEACLSFSPLVYKILTDIIEKTNNGVYVLLNRNPTISFGSILRMRIVKIIPNFHEKVIKVPNAILSLIAGDYDGDVINLFLLTDQSYADHFEAMDPHYFIVSQNDGKFNPAMKLDKDNGLGIYTLLS